MKSKKLGKRKTFALVAALLLAALAGLSALLYRQGCNADYPIPMKRFYQQADGISVGMNRQEVLGTIKVYSSIEDSEKGSLVFSLKPILRPLHKWHQTTLFISVEFDSENRVVRVHKMDG